MGSLVSGGWMAMLSDATSSVKGPRVKDPSLLRALERERVRADRSGLMLAVVFFRIERSLRMIRQRKRLLNLLQKRARITDEVGENGRLGAFALLPDTDEGGASRFAESVSKLFDEHRSRLKFEVMTYRPPQKSRRDDDETGNPNGRGGGRHSTDRIVVVRESEPATATAAAITEPDSWDADNLNMTDTGRLRHLFERPTPLWKRIIDVTAAGTGLLVLSPLLLLLAAAIKLDSRGPVIFRQHRAGRGGRPFTMFKFRTMVTDAEQRKHELMQFNEIDGPAFKIRHDPRVTRVGLLLRRLSLDELPQLVNVLIGDMTLVGPRPLPCKESDRCEHWHRARLHVTPGLTCTWQISGRSEIAFDEWMRMDIDYVRNRGLWTDLRILACTVPAVVTRRGAY
jgi:lipopolysaccharide/colanic/teichoic acid biosynthesis glycosyltransferase